MKNNTITNVYSLTPMQEGMLFHYLSFPDSNEYLSQIIIELSGSVDQTAFEASVNEVVLWHDVLRTAFVHKNLDTPKQVVFAQSRPELFAFHNLSDLSVDAQEIFIKDFFDKDNNNFFDLTRDNLIRFVLFKKSDDSYMFVITHHHIILDGWSMGILFNDFLSIYQALLNNRTPGKRRIPFFANYIKWIKLQDKEKAKNYWQNYLKEFESSSDILGIGKKIVGEIPYKDGLITFSIDKIRTEKLTHLTSEYGVTVNNILQMLWAVIVSRYSNRNDVLFGNVISGRPYDLEGSEDMLGLFINTVPLFVRVEENKLFFDLVKECHRSFADCERFGYLPLSEIQQAVSAKSHLFNHLFVFENYPIEDIKTDEETSASLGFNIASIGGQERSSLPLTVVCVPGEELSVDFYFNRNIISEEDILRLHGHFLKVFDTILDCPDAKIADISIITDKEKEQILYDFNQNLGDYKKDCSSMDVFEDQVLKTPDADALIFEDSDSSSGYGTFTFRELDELANKFARYLLDHGVQAHDYVGFSMDSCKEMIPALFGILKIGAIYLPIDPKSPDKRIEFICREVDLKCFLTQEHYWDKLKDFADTVLSVDKVEVIFASYSGEKISCVVKPEDTAYVIFTSGSTGKPKGVLVGHQSINNLAMSLGESFQLYEGRRMMQFAALSFDATIAEIFPALLNGAALCLFNREEQFSLKHLYKALKEMDVTNVILPPSVLCHLSDEGLTSLKTIISAGEACTKDIFNKWVKGRCFVNGYGPTETTVCATAWSSDEHYDNKNIDIVPVGKPIKNSRVMLINKLGHVQPIGVPGELCVWGDVLSKGYFNRPELNEEKFIFHPDIENQRLYRTGDLAVWKADGHINFLGRIDDQVKINGFRIEVGEIEKQIQKHLQVKEVFVTTFENDNGVKELCCYFIADELLSVQELRNHITDELPVYMVPAHFIQIDYFSLTINGKIDKKALPVPGNRQEHSHYVAPRTDTEKTVVSVWQDVLGISKVGIHDDFFELGGHSLKSIQIISRLEKVGIDVGVSSIFSYPRIEEFARYIDTSQEDNNNIITEKEEAIAFLQDSYSLSSRLVTVEVESFLYLLLFVDSDKSIDREIINNINSRWHNDLIPNYIVRETEGSRNIKNGASLSKDKFDSIMSCLSSIVEVDMDKLLRGLHIESETFNGAVTGNEILAGYPVSSIQKIQLETGRIATGSILTLSEAVDIKQLEVAVNKVLSEQGSLRCVLRKQNGEFYWNEYAPLEKITLPFVDISSYSHDVQNSIMDKIISEFFFHKGFNEDELLYRMYLIKKNNKEYIMVIPFDHLIFDAISADILESSILDSYRGVEYLLPDADSSYKSYVERLIVGPQGIDEAALIEQFLLEKYKIALNLVEDVFLEIKEPSRFIIEGTIDFDCQEENISEQEIWDFCFSLMSKTASYCIGVQELPVKVLQYGRRYGSHNYYNTIGEFIDVIPFWVDVSGEISDNNHRLRENLKYIERHSINFTSFLTHLKGHSGWKVINKLIAPEKINSYDPIVLLNFQGKISDREVDISEHIKIRTLNEKGIDRDFFVFTCSYNSEGIYFNVDTLFVNDQELLNENFEKSINEISHGFEWLERFELSLKK